MSCGRNVHKHRNLLAHAPERLHEEISNDYRDMIYAATRGEVERNAAGAARINRIFVSRYRGNPNAISRRSHLD